MTSKEAHPESDVSEQKSSVRADFERDVIPLSLGNHFIVNAMSELNGTVVRNEDTCVIRSYTTSIPSEMTDRGVFDGALC